MPADYRLGRLKGDYVVTWWEGGKRHRHRLFAGDEAAEVRRSRREAERRLQVFARRVTVQSSPTVGTIWEAYRAAKSGRRVAQAMAFEWRAMERHFGHLMLDDVTIDACRAYTAARRAAGKKDGTIWTELGHLRSALKWAADNRLTPYAPKIERPAKPAPKDRHLTSIECERLINAATAAHIRLAIILLLSTAARVGAVLDLTWDRVDLDRGVIRLRNDDGMTRKGRATVPMNAGVRAALAAAREAAITEHVIEWAGARVASIKTGFNRAVKDAGLADVSPHVLRHTAAVHMAEAGIPMSEIAQYLGHEDSRVTERVYARFRPEHLRRAADVLDFTRVRQVR